MELYTLTLSLDAAAPTTLRTWLGSLLEASAVTRHVAQEIILAVTEAVNNAVRNAEPEGTTVTVTVSIVGRDVYLRVTDRERGTEHEIECESTQEPSVDSTLGLALMQGLMDEVALHCTEEGTTVRLVKRVRLPNTDASGGQNGNGRPAQQTPSAPSAGSSSPRLQQGLARVAAPYQPALRTTAGLDPSA